MDKFKKRCHESITRLTRMDDISSHNSIPINGINRSFQIPSTEVRMMRKRGPCLANLLQRTTGMLIFSSNSFNYILSGSNLITKQGAQYRKQALVLRGLFNYLGTDSCQRCSESTRDLRQSQEGLHKRTHSDVPTEKNNPSELDPATEEAMQSVIHI